MRGLNTLGSILRRVVPVAVLGGALAACTVHGRAGVFVPAPTAVVVVEQPPPPPPRRVVVVQRPGYIWVDGYYRWNGNRYVWRDGYYERQRANHVYRPGRWERRGNGHVWVEGRWEAHGRGHKHDKGDRRKVRDHRR